MALQGIISISMVWVLLFSLFSLLSTTTTYVYGAKARDKWITHEGLFATSAKGPHSPSACGYGNLQKQGYGTNTAAVSNVLFKSGAACGACAKIRCISLGDNLCNKSTTSVTVSVTDFCPPEGLCYKNWHFKLSKSAFNQIAAAPEAGAIPIQYQWVNCQKNGGIKFKITGWYYFTVVLVTNVGGKGDVQSLMIKAGPGKAWKNMNKLWGQNWMLYTPISLVKKTVSFRVTISDKRSLTSYDVAPENWKFGHTYTSSNQFDYNP